jgi:hypothetical protein
MRVERYGKTRYWTVIDIDGSLVCLCVYRKGAEESSGDCRDSRRRQGSLRSGQEHRTAPGPFCGEGEKYESLSTWKKLVL